MKQLLIILLFLVSFSTIIYGKFISPKKNTPRIIAYAQETKIVKNSHEKSNSLEYHKASPSDISIPLYPSGYIIKSRKTRGFSPYDREVIIASIEMCSLDPIDKVIHYYRKIKKLYIKNFEIDGGRNVILSDLPGIVLFADKKLKRGTTLLIYRDNEKGRTRMIYTSFYQI